MATFTATREQIDAVQAWKERNSWQRMSQPLLPLLVNHYGLTSGQALVVIKASKKEASDGGS